MTYYDYESGRRNIPEKHIPEICERFSCHPSELFSVEWHQMIASIQNELSILIDDQDIAFTDKSPELRQWMALALQHGIIDLSKGESETSKDLSDIFSFVKRKKKDEDTDK